jgi:hypothetical protein
MPITQRQQKINKKVVTVMQKKEGKVNFFFGFTNCLGSSVVALALRNSPILLLDARCMHVSKDGCQFVDIEKLREPQRGTQTRL